MFLFLCCVRAIHNWTERCRKYMASLSGSWIFPNVARKYYFRCTFATDHDSAQLFSKCLKGADLLNFKHFCRRPFVQWNFPIYYLSFVLNNSLTARDLFCSMCVKIIFLFVQLAFLFDPFFDKFSSLPAFCFWFSCSQCRRVPTQLLVVGSPLQEVLIFRCRHVSTKKNITYCQTRTLVCFKRIQPVVRISHVLFVHNHLTFFCFCDTV